VGGLYDIRLFFFCIFVLVGRIEVSVSDCSRVLVWCLCLLFSSYGSRGHTRGDGMAMARQNNRM
jgi:hypothetical protein